MTEARLVTFALLCFNQEAFVADALESALAQDYSPLEILISDDGSTDRTWDIVQERVRRYAGPHRIRLHRNATNLSCTVHTLSALAMASGDLVVVGAGDDISEPGRTRAVAETAAANPDAMSFWSDMRLIDEQSRDLGFCPGYAIAGETDLEGLAQHGAAPPGASQAYRKEVGASFGPVDRRAGSEDIVLHFRAALLGKVAKAPGILVLWRRHLGSMESVNSLSAVPPEVFAAKAATIVRQRLFCYRARLADLQEFERRNPGRAGQVAELRRITQEFVGRSEATLEIAEGGGAGAISGAYKAWRRGTRLMDIARNVALFRFPGLWQRYTRRRAGAGR